jgi:hypothetical protein
MNLGRIVFSGTAEEFAKNDDVIAQHLAVG